MPGYRYELVVRREQGVEKVPYWSAFKLRPGTRILFEHEELVVEQSFQAEDSEFEFDQIAVCRPAPPNAETADRECA